MFEGYAAQGMELLTKTLPQYFDSTTSTAILGVVALVGTRLLFPLAISLLGPLLSIPSRIIGGIFYSRPRHYRRPIFYSSGSRWSVGILCFIAGIFVASYINRSTNNPVTAIASESKPVTHTVVKKKSGFQEFEVVSSIEPAPIREVRPLITDRK